MGMKEMNDLTEKQIAHWRKVLTPMFGPYALIMPVESIEKMRNKMDETFRQPNDKETCPNCKSEIDPDYCWCGIYKDSHNIEDHGFVPMGCECGFTKQPKGKK